MAICSASSMLFVFSSLTNSVNERCFFFFFGFVSSGDKLRFLNERKVPIEKVRFGFFVTFPPPALLLFLLLHWPILRVHVVSLLERRDALLSLSIDVPKRGEAR